MPSSFRKSISSFAGLRKGKAGCFSRPEEEFDDPVSTVPVSAYDRRQSRVSSSTRTASVSSGHSAASQNDSYTFPSSSNSDTSSVEPLNKRISMIAPDAGLPGRGMDPKRLSMLSMMGPAGGMDSRQVTGPSRALSLPNIYEDQVPVSLSAMMHTKSPEEANPYSDMAKKTRYSMPVQTATYDNDWWSQHD